MQDNNIFTLVVEDNTDDGIVHYVGLYELPVEWIGDTFIIDKLKEIAHYYLETEAGKKEYQHNGESYTWNDFLNIPASFLEKYQVHEMQICSYSLQTVDANESLA